MAIPDTGALFGDETNSYGNDYMEHVSKVRRDIIEDCLLALGYPVITIFITQRQIDRLIDFAVRKCEDKASQMFLETFNVTGGVIDVSDYHMAVVRNVYPADLSVNNNNTNLVVDEDNNSCSDCSLSGCDICDKLCRYRFFPTGLAGTGYNNAGLYDMLTYQYARSEMRKLVLDDFYLDVSEGKLYLDGYSGMVTVEYIKDSVTVEDIASNVYWKGWVRDYTLAMAKITEGRIRGKYKISSGVFEIESDELISEGQSEKENLESKLEEDMGYWNIMR